VKRIILLIVSAKRKARKWGREPGRAQRPLPMDRMRLGGSPFMLNVMEHDLAGMPSHNLISLTGPCSGVTFWSIDTDAPSRIRIILDAHQY
jgi:hypothetical protein